MLSIDHYGRSLGSGGSIGIVAGLSDGHEVGLNVEHGTKKLQFLLKLLDFGLDP